MESLGFHTRFPNPLHCLFAAESEPDVSRACVDEFNINRRSSSTSRHRLRDRDDINIDDASDTDNTGKRVHSGTTDGNGGTDDAGMGASARAEYSPVEHMLVNDFLMDSRLSDVCTTCYMQRFSNAEWKILRQAQPMKKRLLFRIWFFC